eukprot:gb/GEZN01022484.1/.p1 GENE.gb/GEZN01022484.1/~~gb/GEZN01022484.1/.p1  ORF type:complete len:167 (+),score=31.58 gb/GEZN01022484.1/:23-523(+)
MTIKFLLLINRQGKVRLAKWYQTYSRAEQSKMIREVSTRVVGRASKMCNFLEWNDGKIIYKRYASLYFMTYVDNTDNELEHLIVIHHFVEILDRYFGNVCELDLIFNFHKAFYLLDEVLLAGELQETSKKRVLHAMLTQDSIENPSGKEEVGSQSLQKTLRAAGLG